MADSDPSQSTATGQEQSALSFQRLCDIVAKLRAPGGCPWDREQTHESILPQMIEEAYELAEAVRANDTAHFREELGDVLLHVVMQGEIAREAGRFNIDDVVRQLSEKLVRRHPHVFGASDAHTSGAVVKQWEAIKRAEKSGQYYLDTLPKALPALMRAQKAQAKVARVNFDWAELGDVIAKVEEELGELKTAIAILAPASSSGSGQDRRSIEEEIGDLLFAVVNLARKCQFDAESVLQAATDKFVERFKRLEDELHARDKKLGDVDLAELDAIWNQIKKNAQRQPQTSELDVAR
jgi:MazG family protein